MFFFCLLSFQTGHLVANSVSREVVPGGFSKLLNVIREETFKILTAYVDSCAILLVDVQH